MLKVGDTVTIDADNDDWGRVTGKAEILDIDEYGFVLVNAAQIRANITVFKDEITLDT